MKTASKVLLKGEPVKLLRDALEAKKRIYDTYPYSFTSGVQEQLKSLNELIRELTKEVMETNPDAMLD